MSGFSTIDLQKRSEQQDALEHTQVDSNWTTIEQAVNKMANSLNQVINPDGELVLNSVDGRGIKNGTLPSSKFSEMLIGSDTGTVNAIELVVSDNIDSINSNTIVGIRIANAITGATTLTIRNNTKTLGTGQLFKQGNLPMEVGDLKGGSFIWAIYTQPNFYLANTLAIEDPELKITNSHFQVWGPQELALNHASINDSNTTVSWNHGLSGTPSIDAWLECTSTEHGYSVGDRIELGYVTTETGYAQYSGLTVKANSTSVSIWRHTDALFIPDFVSDADSYNQLDEAKWKIVITARYQVASTANQYTQSPFAVSAGSTRGAVTVGTDLYVIDSPHNIQGDGLNTQRPRFLKYNLSNNNVTSLYNFPGVVVPRWNAAPAIVKWTSSDPIIMWVASSNVDGTSTHDNAATLMYYDVNAGELKNDAITVYNTPQDGIHIIDVLGSTTKGATTIPDDIFISEVKQPIGNNGGAGGTVGQIASGVTYTNSITFKKLSWNAGSVAYAEDSTGSIDLDDDAAHAYTGRATFASLTNGNIAVLSVMHNPVKKRLYVVTSDRMCHIFTYTSASWDAFHTKIADGTWHQDLSYTKTIAVTGIPNLTITQNQSVQCREHISMEYDLSSGAEVALISNFHGQEYGQGGAVIVTPWVE